MKRLFATILACLMVVGLVACGGNSAPPQNTPTASPKGVSAASDAAPAESTAAKKPIIGVLVFDYANNYVTYIRNSIVNIAGENADIQMVDAQNDQAKQVEQVDLMLSKGVDVLCVNAVDPKAATTIISKAKAADVPLIFFNRSPSKDDIMSYEKCWYVGTTPADSGRMQSEMAMEAFKADPALDKNGDGKLQYVIVKGTLGHPDAEARTEANQKTFADAGFAAEVLDIQTGDFKTATSKDVMDVWMGKYGDQVEMVLTNSDAMLLGAVQSAKAEGYFAGDDKKKMAAVGINALPEVLDLIDSGVVYGSVLSDAYSEGMNIYTMAMNVAQSRDVYTDVTIQPDDMKAIRVPYVPISKANLNVARDMYKNALAK